MADLAGLRLVQINHDTVVIARRSMPIDEVRAFYEKEEEMEALDVRLVGMFDRPDPAKTATYADSLRKRELTSLPEFL